MVSTKPSLQGQVLPASSLFLTGLQVTQAVLEFSHVKQVLSHLVQRATPVPASVYPAMQKHVPSVPLKFLKVTAGLQFTQLYFVPPVQL